VASYPDAASVAELLQILQNRIEELEAITVPTADAEPIKDLDTTHLNKIEINDRRAPRADTS
jgi:hypothetical protein